MVLVCSGEHAAFAELVGRHTDRFFALAYRTLNNANDAEDVVQSAFIKLWQHPRRWDSDKSQFTTWFYRVIINACHDCMRQQKSSVSVDGGVIEHLVEPIVSEERNLEQSQTQQQQQQALNNAIKTLPSSQRDALNMVVYLGLPQKEVADIMNVSVKAVESLLIRAKRSIANRVQKGIPGPLNKVSLCEPRRLSSEN